MKPPAILRVGVGLGEHRVVVVLGVDRIDGDERHLAPVLAAGFEPGGARFLGLGQRLAAEYMRDLVRVDRDQADRALALERAEPFLDARGRQAEAALRDQLDRDQVAVLRVRGRAGGDVEFAPGLLLVDRHEPPAAVRQRAEHADLALARAVEHLDDAAGVADRVAVLAGLLGAGQHAVADAGDFGGARLARDMDADARGFAVRVARPIRSGPRSARRPRSRSVTSASTTAGRAPAWCSFLRRCSTLPSSASSRSICFSAARSAFFRPKARAISRTPALPLCVPMKARTFVAGGEGAGLVLGRLFQDG